MSVYVRVVVFLTLEYCILVDHNPILYSISLFQYEFPSGFFYINGVIYDDTRDSKSKRYSEGIINWAKNNGIGQFHFSCSLIPFCALPFVHDKMIRSFLNLSVVT